MEVVWNAKRKRYISPLPVAWTSTESPLLLWILYDGQVNVKDSGRHKGKMLSSTRKERPDNYKSQE